MLILGDFNIHVDKPEAGGASRFADILSSHHFKQHVNFPTHTLGHSLDLVISRSKELTEVNSVLPGEHLTDHCAVHCSLSVNKPSAPRRTITMRRLADINIEQFRKDIDTSPLGQPVPNHTTVESMVSQYNHVLGRLLDEHAPQYGRSVYIRPDSQWYNQDVTLAKREKRKFERQWLKSRRPDHLSEFKRNRNMFNKKIKTAKTTYYRDKLTACHRDTSELFKVYNTIAGHKKKSTFVS